MLQTYSESALLDQNWVNPAILEQAFQWLRKQRRFYSIHDGTWNLSLHWSRMKNHFISLWQRGNHSFSPMIRHRFATTSIAVYEPGITRGSALSPLLGAIVLQPLDNAIVFFITSLHRAYNKSSHRANKNETALFLNSMTQEYSSFNHYILEKSNAADTIRNEA